MAYSNEAYFSVEYTTLNEDDAGRDLPHRPSRGTDPGRHGHVPVSADRRPFYDVLRWPLAYLAWASVAAACLVTLTIH